ncbi:MAG: HIT domain-containing protein [Bacteroidetes bacterium]|nr:HIT domain-containing protein [Bacteroidota bacterium]
MPTLFTRIIQGEIPCYRVAESERYLAFLDIFPQALGHVLVVPKVEVDYLFDLDDEVLSGLLPFAKNVAKAIEAVVPCKRIGVAVIGLEVPHAHVHLVPLNRLSDLDFTQPKLQVSAEELEALAASIRAQLG